MRLELTKRTGDAIRMLMYLTEVPVGERRTSTEISSAAGVTKGNVPTLVAALSRAGLLDCVRGRGGGCALGRPAEEISIAEVVVAIEGSLEPEHCAVDVRRCAERDAACGIHDSWRAIIDDLQERLARLTLADAVARHEANRRAHDPPA